MPRSSRVAWLFSASLALSACAQHQQAAAPAPPPPAVTVVRPPPTPSEPVVVTAPGWTFDAASCVAHTGGRAFSLSLRGDDASVQITLAYGKSAWRGRTVPLAYQGRAGRWVALGRIEGGRTIVVSSPVSDDSVGRALILLAGGTLTAQQPSGRRLVLHIQSGGNDGQVWFECLKRRLLP